MFKETKIPVLSVTVIEKLICKSYDDIYDLIIKHILVGSYEEVKQAFIALDIVLVYKEKIEPGIEIEEDLINFFKSIRYMDISKSRSVLLHLSQIIDRKLFLSDKYEKVIIQSFKECLDIYEIGINNNINKDYLDTLFNLSNIAKKYYKALINSNLQIPEEMHTLVERFKNSSLNEVKNAWEGL